MTAKVSIVMVTNSKPHLLRQVLASLLRQDYAALEIIVVVNGAHREIASILAEQPAVRVIQNEQNLGFTVGMNQGAAAATGAYLYLTANDIEPAPDYLRRLVETAERTPGFGLLSGIWYDHAHPQKSVGGGGGLHFGLRNRLTIETNAGGRTDPFAVDWVAGASIFTRFDVWRAFGGFREDFFFHCEDLDLSVRIRRAGGYVCLVPAARLYHHEHDRSISRNQTVELHKLKNYLALNFLYAPWYAIPWQYVKYFGYTAPRIAWYVGSMRFLLRVWGKSLARTPGLLWERITRRPQRLVGME